MFLIMTKIECWPVFKQDPYFFRPADGTSNLHLSSQNYGICVAARIGYCSITWAPNTVDQNATYTFLMSQDTSGLSEDILGEFFFFFLRDFIFKKTLFEKLQYLKQEQ